MRNSIAEPALVHPIILPMKSHISQLIIRHFHERIEHQGRGLTLNEIKSNGFWILGCSSAVSKEIFHCVFVKNNEVILKVRKWPTYHLIALN